MKLKTGIPALIVAALAFASNGAFGQASIYVDANRGSDSNPGTLSAPFRTVQAGTNKAETNNTQGIATQVLINPGVYREFVLLGPRSGQTSASITLQAAQTGAAIISGSDVVTGWNRSSGSVYSHSWSFSLGGCPSLAKLPAGASSIAFQREMIFVNGNLLTQVLSRSAMHAGTFYADHGGQQMYIWLADSSNPNNATVEVSARAHTLEVLQRQNVVLRGLVFQHAASCVNDDSVSVMSSSNVLVDAVKTQWNNFGGLHLSTTTNSTVQNSVGMHNGGIGFSGYKNKGILFQFDESDYNNWRGAMGNFYDYGMGGFKFMLTHGGSFQKLFAYHNQAQGLWFDTDNKNITVDGAVIVGNYYQNVQIELNQGPITMSNSVVCSGSNGLLFEETHGLTVSNSIFYNNGGSNNQAQIFLAGKPGGRSMTDWETGQYYNLTAESVTFSGNKLADGGSGQYVFGTYTGGSDWSNFVNTLSSNNNQWYDANNAAAFDLPSSTYVNLSGWRSQTGQDSSSSWSISSAVASACGSHP